MPEELDSEGLAILKLLVSLLPSVDPKRPDRDAPLDFLLQVARLLKVKPLTCALCGGLMQLKPANKLLQPSPDRIDSAIGDYGPKNFQLAHLACNLGKNNTTEMQFDEWLQVVKSATEPTPDAGDCEKLS